MVLGFLVGLLCASCGQVCLCVKPLNGVLVGQVLDDLGKDTGHENECGSGGKALGVTRLVLGGPEEDTVDTGRVTEGVDDGDTSCTLGCGARHDVGHPHEGKGRHGVHCTESDDEQAVFDVEVVDNVDDDEAHTRNRGSEGDVVGTLLTVV